jgi:ribosome-associated protein
MIPITPFISIDEDEISETFVRASGPGGQNVNKVASAVQLRFHIRQSPNLPADVRARLERLGGQRVTREGVIVISADRFRSQEQNRDDARDRLITLIRAAAVRPKIRRPTRPTLGSKERRLEGKKVRAVVKSGRRKDFDD